MREGVFYKMSKIGILAGGGKLPLSIGENLFNKGNNKDVKIPKFGYIVRIPFFSITIIETKAPAPNNKSGLETSPS